MTDLVFLTADSSADARQAALLILGQELWLILQRGPWKDPERIQAIDISETHRINFLIDPPHDTRTIREFTPDELAEFMEAQGLTGSSLTSADVRFDELAEASVNEIESILDEWNVGVIFKQLYVNKHLEIPMPHSSGTPRICVAVHAQAPDIEIFTPEGDTS